MLRSVVRSFGAVLFARRQIDLSRWTRRSEFVDVRGAVVTWLDAFLVAMERDCAWLCRVGSDVADECRAEVRSSFELSFGAPRRRATAGCRRSVIAVYGFDGDLAARLTEFARVLSDLGWVGAELGVTQGLLGSRSSGSLHWRPAPAFAPPPTVAALPPWGNRMLEPRMGVLWSGRGEEMRLRRDALWTRGESRNHLTLESSGTDFWSLPDRALERSEYALAVILEVGYYANPAGLERPHRLPRHLLPSRRTGWEE